MEVNRALGEDRRNRQKQLAALKELCKLMPDKKPAEDISPQEWHSNTMSLIGMLEGTSNGRQKEIVGIYKRIKLSAKQALSLIEEDTLILKAHKKELIGINRKHSRILLNSEPYKFFRSEVFLISTRELLNTMILAMETKAFFDVFIAYMSERLDRINIEISPFEERERLMMTKAKKLVKSMMKEGGEFSEYMDKTKNVTANQLGLYFVRERNALVFGKRNLKTLISKLEKNQPLELNELSFIRKFLRVEEMLSNQKLTFQQMRNDHKELLYVMNKHVKGMLKAAGAGVEL